MRGEGVLIVEVHGIVAQESMVILKLAAERCTLAFLLLRTGISVGEIWAPQPPHRFQVSRFPWSGAGEVVEI
jgi:hypothetical protein